MKDHKLSDLVLDYSLYPRKEIDRHHASILQEAIENGAEVPPIVICQTTKRIVDGFHRYRAYKRISKNDPNYLVRCVEKKYKSDGELFLDAMRFNANHGRALNKFDRTHCILVAQQLEVAEKDIAKVLHVPLCGVQTLYVDRTATGTNGKQQLMAIKSTIKHKAGQNLTAEQTACNEKLGGMQASFYVNQIIMLIENDLIDRANEKLMERLVVLAGLLRKWK